MDSTRMMRYRSGCLLCGSDLEYGVPMEMECSLCGRKNVSDVRCMNGHYICDRCHSSPAVDGIYSICMESKEKDPVAIAMKCMMLPNVNMHGPEHHIMVGSCILSAAKNAGRDLNLSEALTEMRRRGSQVPGGTCGYWGCCGSAISAGIACSILLGSTPLGREEFGLCNKLTGRCLQSIGEIGGPRCCKRDSFVSMTEAVRFFSENGIAELELPEKIVCRYYAENKQCKGKDCPFHP